MAGWVEMIPGREGEPAMIDEKFKDIVGIIEATIPIAQKMGVKIVGMRDRYARIMMPLEPNINHIGTMYAGSLFTLGEFSGGVIYAASFDLTRFFPIVKEVSIRFLRLAKTDMHLELELTKEQVEQITREADEKGKADYGLDLKLMDDQGEVCAVVNGTWQLRKN
ncbi:MAG TPA: DUF4442 domain-containing protein [Deltaproteobacteria bacterium]|nr:DUF4442 domain-containing protein [Deltaproteobacteria bacterium]